MNERLPWFHCYPTKLLGALGGMSPDQQLVYVILLLRIYEVRGPCSDTFDVIARRIGINKRRVTDALNDLFKMGKLEQVRDGIMNPFAEKVLTFGDENHEKRVRAGAEGGKRAAEKRKEKQDTTPSSAAPTPNQEDLDKEKKKEERQTQAPAEAGLFADDASSQSDWPKDYQDQFWKAYPRRTEKKAAMAKLDAIRKGGKIRWAIFFASIQRYAQHMRGTEERYIKHPTTWLNRGCWDDEFGPDPGSGQRPSRNGVASLLVQLTKGRRDDNDEGLEPSRALPAR